MTPARQPEFMQLAIVRAPEPPATDALPSLIAAERARLAALQLRHGAILFRGFAVTEPAQLARAVAAAAETPMRYVGGSSPRTPLAERVYTSTQLPPEVRIPLHSELAYVNAYPRHLWFCCAVPPAAGGETVLADARQVYRAIDPAVRRRFIARRVRYRCSFHGPSAFFALVDRLQKVTRSWMEAFETTDPALAEARCRELGADVHWLASGRLVMEIVRPAAISHPETGEPLWFNFAHLFRLNPRYLGQLRYRLAQLFFVDQRTRTQDAHYGDGGEIDAATIDHLFDVLEAQTVSFPWQRGDVLWLDNLLCMHGRNPFRGPRRVLAAMSR
jgi:alpha-ketoglutarate-dependent taurine dioxygenase